MGKTYRSKDARTSKHKGRSFNGKRVRDGFRKKDRFRFDPRDYR